MKPLHVSSQKLFSIRSVLEGKVPPVSLPDMLQGSRTCKYCYTNRECTLYAEATLHQAPDPINDPLSDKPDLRSQFTEHLASDDFAYFSKWDHLIDLEADFSEVHSAKAWLKESSFIEEHAGQSMSSLVFERESSSERGRSSSVLFFRRSAMCKSTIPLSRLDFEPNCHVIISVDSEIVSQLAPGLPRPRMHIVRGFLQSSTENSVVVHATISDLFRIHRLVTSTRNTPEFRIDRDNVSTGIGTLRQNLVGFFTGDRVKSETGADIQRTTHLPRLRNCIIRGKAPRFCESSTQQLFRAHLNNPTGIPTGVLPGCGLPDLAIEYSELNRNQQEAVMKVFLV